MILDHERQSFVGQIIPDPKTMNSTQNKFLSLDNDRATLKGRMFGSTGASQFGMMGSASKAA